jgi:hypothetical protein
MDEVMSGNQEQRAILDAELYWFGGGLGAPKVYDTGTNFHAAPTLRGTAAGQRTRPKGGGGDRPRRMRAYFNDRGDWTVEITKG